MARASKKALIEQIDKLIKTSVIVYVGLAALAVLLMSGQSTNLVWEYSTADTIASQTSNQLGVAEKTLFDVEYRYVLAGVLAFSAILLILLATNYRKAYAKTVKASISGFRWTYMGLSSAALLGLIALTFGINEVTTLKVIGLLIILTTVLGWITERETVKDKKSAWFPFTASLVAGVVAWLPIIGVVLGAWIFGMSGFAWYVYVAAAVALLGFTGFAYNKAMVLRQKGEWQTYEFAERNYFAIDLATKSLVSLALIIGLTA
jgi:hypothetical protein